MESEVIDNSLPQVLPCALSRANTAGANPIGGVTNRRVVAELAPQPLEHEIIMRKIPFIDGKEAGSHILYEIAHVCEFVTGQLALQQMQNVHAYSMSAIDAEPLANKSKEEPTRGRLAIISAPSLVRGEL